MGTCPGFRFKGRVPGSSDRVPGVHGGLPTLAVLVVAGAAVLVAGAALLGVKLRESVAEERRPLHHRMEVEAEIDRVFDGIGAVLGGSLRLVFADGRGSGQRFVLEDGRYDTLALRTTIPLSQDEVPTPCEARYVVYDPDGEGPSSGVLLLEIRSDPNVGDEGDSEPTRYEVCAGVEEFQIRYFNVPRPGSGGEGRFFDIGDPGGYDARDATGEWTGRNPYLKERGRLVISSEVPERPDAGPLPSRLRVVLAVRHPASGVVVRRVRQLAIPVS